MADRTTSLREKLAEMERADEAVFFARRDAGLIASIDPGDPGRHESSFCALRRAAPRRASASRWGGPQSERSSTNRRFRP
jgi:hypothetical protein